MVITPVHYIAFPLLAAFLIPLVGKISRQAARIIPGIVLTYLAFVSVTLMIEVQSTGFITETLAGWKAPWGINLVFSKFSGLLATLISFMGLIIWAYSFNFKKVETEISLKYQTLQMMMVTGALGMVLTGDIFNLFVFLEIVAISAYSLTALYRNRDGAEAAFKYLLIGSFASAFILLGIMILYTQVGTLNMAEIAVRMVDVPVGMKTLILIFFLVGFGIEAEIFPLNGWAPDAYSQAPGPVGAAFAAIVVKAGVYALIRIIFTIFDLEVAHEFLIYAGFVTMIIAELSALRQTNLKRMLAFSSIGQVGFVLVAFGIGTQTAVVGALFLMINHAVIKGLLFMSGSYLVYDTPGKEINALKGIAKQLPIVSFFFALGAFAIVGLPPFAGFWAKLWVLTAAAEKEMIMLIVIILLISVVEIIYYFRVLNKLYFEKREEQFEVVKPTVQAFTSMAILAAVIVFVGLYPDALLGFLKSASETLLDKSIYISNVLGQNMN